MEEKSTATKKPNSYHFSPLFVILGMSKPAAASASLFLNLIAAGSAAATYAGKKMVDFSLSIPLIVASSIAAPMGSYINIHIDTVVFMVVMSAVLALAGVRMLFSPQADEQAQEISPFKKAAGGAAIGFCIGLMGGLFGIGGGVSVVLLLIYVLKTLTRIAAASSTFIVCFSSFTGFLGYASMGSINWAFILPAAIASFAGGQAGAGIMSTRIKGKTIQVVFPFILFGLCLKLLHQSFFS